jgi:hypothetical protein
MDKVEKYFAKHIVFNSAVHILAGVGFGALLVNPIFNPHPVRFGAFFIILAVLGYWYAWDNYKGKK